MDKITTTDLLSDEFATIKGSRQLTIEINWDNSTGRESYTIDVSSNTHENKIESILLSDIENNFCLMNKETLRGEIMLSIYTYLEENKKSLWYDLRNVSQ
jgi:hypothetical protein